MKDYVISPTHPTGYQKPVSLMSLHVTIRYVPRIIYTCIVSGGTRLEVCCPGSGSDVSLGLPLGVDPGLCSPLHPSYLQVGQHHCP